MRHVAALALPIFIAACSDATASPSEDAGSTGDAASTVDAGALDGNATNDAPIDAPRTACQGVLRAAARAGVGVRAALKSPHCAFSIPYFRKYART